MSDIVSKEKPKRPVLAFAVVMIVLFTIGFAFYGLYYVPRNTEGNYTYTTDPYTVVITEGGYDGKFTDFEDNDGEVFEFYDEPTDTPERLDVYVEWDFSYIEERGDVTNILLEFRLENRNDGEVTCYARNWLWNSWSFVGSGSDAENLISVNLTRWHLSSTLQFRFRVYSDAEYMSVIFDLLTIEVEYLVYENE